MIKRFVAASLWISVLAPLVVRADAQTWIQAKSPHFELATTLSPDAARAAARYFEQVRSFFLASSPLARSEGPPVRIVVFGSAAQYEPYRLNDSSSAYYTHDVDHDFIVMQDLDPAHYRIAVHEYTHLVIARAGLRLPLWMNEGWADLNSTLKPKGHKAIVGDILPERMETLKHASWIPLADLDKVDQRSPVYNERDRAGVFYAESWAFLHMLFLSPEYRKQFNAFVGATVAAKGIAQACQDVLGKTAPAVQADLERYVERNKLYGAVFDVDLNASEEEPQVTNLSAFDSALLLADLLTVIRKTEPARAAYEEIEKRFPGHSETQEGLGEVSLEASDRDAALAHFDNALQKGPADAAVCFRLAMLSRKATTDRTLTIHALRRALELKPDWPAARLQLGIALADTRDYSASLAELQNVRKITGDIAAWYFAATAFDDLKLGNREGARLNVDRANRWAKTAAEKEQIQRIVQALDSGKALQGAPTK